MDAEQKFVIVRDMTDEEVEAEIQDAYQWMERARWKLDEATQDYQGWLSERIERFNRAREDG